MAEYIERDALMAILDAKADMVLPDFAPGFHAAVKCVKAMPAADVEPVRHGWWLAYCDFWRKCSECGETWHEQWVIRKALRYCPNCGARMDGEEDGHE